MASRAEELRDELRPEIEGEKTLILKMLPGKRPEVVFTGAWSGKYIKAAMDSIAKGYRVSRRRVLLPTREEVGTITQGGK
jgi:hypothetical protein